MKVLIFALALAMVMATAATSSAAKTVPSLTLTLLRNGKQVGGQLHAPLGTTSIAVTIKSTKSNTSDRIVATFTHNGLNDGMPWLVKPAKGREVDVGGLSMSINLNSSRSNIYRMKIPGQVGTKVPSGANGVAIWLYGGAAYTTFQWTLPTARTRPVSITDMNADGIAIACCS